WAGRPSDGDVGVVRIGAGAQTLATTLVPPASGVTDELEPISAAALRSFLATYAVVPDLPVSLALTGFARVHLPDASTAARAMVRAMIAQLSVVHAPHALIVSACVAPHRRAEWDYLQCLPH